MLDASKLNGDFNNLNGLLLIKAHEVRTGLHYFDIAPQGYEVFFGVAPQGYEAFFSVVKCLSKIVGKTPDGNLDKSIEDAEKQYKLTGHLSDVEINDITVEGTLEDIDDGSDIEDEVPTPDEEVPSYDFNIFGIRFYSESDISYKIVPQTRIDIYDLGFVLNLEEYKHNAVKVIFDYFIAYTQQQSDRDY